MKLSTESYKGVRDFYPEDMFVENYIFNTWRKTAENFGYQEYNASVLEPSELYKAKSGEEIVNEQTYTFRDRSDRDVTLRPEMTPTVARMVAAHRRDLAFPVRWYSIPNLFRYEQPQRGRLREHWQLNVDIFGVKGVEAEVEVIMLASSVMKAFGAKDADFEIHINNRMLLNFVLGDYLGLKEFDAKRITKLIDKKEKMDAGVFKIELEKLFMSALPTRGDSISKEVEIFLTLLSSKKIADFKHNLVGIKNAGAAMNIPGADALEEVLATLERLGLKNVHFSPTLVRGFDYYTGIVFEVFDTNIKNKRSMFGGGRYDDLLSLFDNEQVPAFGFGMGDVTMRDFLEIHNLIPAYKPSTKLAIATLGAEYFEKAQSLANSLRARGLAVAVDLTTRKVADQIKAAVKQSIPFITVIGEDEAKNSIYKVKELATSKESLVSEDQIVGLIEMHE